MPPPPTGIGSCRRRPPASVHAAAAHRHRSLIAFLTPFYSSIYQSLLYIAAFDGGADVREALLLRVDAAAATGIVTAAAAAAWRRRENGRWRLLPFPYAIEPKPNGVYFDTDADTAANADVAVDIAGGNVTDRGSARSGGARSITISRSMGRNHLINSSHSGSCLLESGGDDGSLEVPDFRFQVRYRLQIINANIICTYMHAHTHMLSPIRTQSHAVLIC
jgi:hypothetical protein